MCTFHCDNGFCFWKNPFIYYILLSSHILRNFFFFFVVSRHCRGNKFVKNFINYLIRKIITRNRAKQRPNLYLILYKYSVYKIKTKNTFFIWKLCWKQLVTTIKTYYSKKRKQFLLFTDNITCFELQSQYDWKRKWWKE